MLTLDDRLILQPGVLLQEIGGEIVIVIPSKEEFVVLNQSGAFLMSRVKQSATLRQLASDLVQRYDLSSSQAQADVLSWANNLLDAKALAIVAPSL